MTNNPKSFINRPTCAIILSVLGFVFLLSAFIVGQTNDLFTYDTVANTAQIWWDSAAIYLSFMLVAGLIMCMKWFSCTLRHYKLEPTNKLLMANLVIELLAALVTIVAAFGIFMFKKENTVEDIQQWLEVMQILSKPTTVLSSIALGLGFFGCVTNLVTLAKEK